MSKVVHFEIPMDDPDRAAGFYRDALGVTPPPARPTARGHAGRARCPRPRSRGLWGLFRQSSMHPACRLAAGQRATARAGTGPGTHLGPVQAPAHQVAYRLNHLQVLGAQAWALAPGPGVADADRLAGQRGVGGSVPHDGAAAGVSRSVDVNHARPPLPRPGLPLRSCPAAGQQDPPVPGTTNQYPGLPR